MWNDSHAISALINLNEQLICYSSRLISKSHSHRAFSGVVQLWMVKKHRPTLLCSVWKGKRRTIRYWMFNEIDFLTSSSLQHIFFFFALCSSVNHSMWWWGGVYESLQQSKEDTFHAHFMPIDDNNLFCTILFLRFCIDLFFYAWNLLEIIDCSFCISVVFFKRVVLKLKIMNNLSFNIIYIKLILKYLNIFHNTSEI